MLKKYEKFKFRFAYDLAGFIHNLIYENLEQEYLSDHFNVEDEDFIRRISKPQKDTLLHEFICYHWEFRNEYTRSKADYETTAEEFEKILDTYEISYPERPTRKNYSNYEQYDKAANQYLDTLENLLDPLTEKIVREVFNILFNDRMFLLKFNEIVATEVKNMKKSDFPNLMDRDGKLKRLNYRPIWLENAVFYRDKGRCQICGKDLSKLFSLEGTVHYDHIVPLAQGGTNEPINFQLLCEECNLEKSGIDSKTGENYQIYW